MTDPPSKEQESIPEDKDLQDMPLVVAVIPVLFLIGAIALTVIQIGRAHV